MIFSTEQTFSDDQAITGTAVSTNVIDLGTTGTAYGSPAALVRDVGKGNPVAICIQVTQDFTLLTSLAVGVQVSAVEAFNDSPVTVVSASRPIAGLKAGDKFPILYVPKDVKERYVRLTYTVTGTNPDGGTLKAGIVKAVQTNDTVPGA